MTARTTFSGRFESFSIFTPNHNHYRYMKKKIIAVTHGKKTGGANPQLDEKGQLDILVLAEKLPINEITGVIVGTGVRFAHTFSCLCDHKSIREKLLSFTPQFCPLLGSADSGTIGESGGFDVILADGRQVKAGGYLGLSEAAGINLWAFLWSLPDGTLLVTGRELIIALGTKDAKSATIYEIEVGHDASEQSVTEIS